MLSLVQDQLPPFTPHKVWVIKTFTNLNDHIDIIFLARFKIFVSLKLQIFVAFLRVASYYCSFTMWETRAIFVKLFWNWNVLISSKCAIFWNSILKQTLKYIPFRQIFIFYPYSKVQSWLTKDKRYYVLWYYMIILYENYS